MKICTTCKQEKDNTEFNKNRVKKDGLNNICRSCSNARSRRFYEENTESHKKISSVRRIRILDENRSKMLSLLKNSKCKDCGNSDIRTFEFDHTSNNKYKDVGNLLSGGYSWSTVQEEINKCDIVCANCHRIRTFSRMKTYRNM